MVNQEKPIDKLIYDLRERAKELNCLYEVQEILGTPGISIEDVCQRIVQVIPPGWQYPDVCQARITLGENSFQTPGFKSSLWVQTADILIQDDPVGRIEVFYTQERPQSDEGPFLKEERKLINTIAEQFGFYLLHQQLREVFQEQMRSEDERKGKWMVIIDLLKRTDPSLLMRISRKMVTYLDWMGIKEAERLLEQYSTASQEPGEFFDANRPFQGKTSSNLMTVIDEAFDLASKHLSQEVILENIQRWIKEDRSGFLINILVNPASSLDEINSALERYHLLGTQSIDLTPLREKWFRVALIRRILSDQASFIKNAKEYIDIDDFGDFLNRLIYPVGSHGKLGGKSSGLFLAAQILNKSPRDTQLLSSIKTPKTWYLSSDTVFYFMSYNNLGDILEQKYKDLGHIRQEYPYVVHEFKNSQFPPEILRGLSLALDDLGDVPLIVRSSSLLEDRTGAAFAGKYKSLFIANIGSKEERLEALIDAITEVFASMFAPDPIEYRVEHDLIDYHEEMGILIQEVVGTRVGHYYLPAFAGVAFSNNEFPWSKRIKKEDSLVRLVPGLGTRAVNRLSDDYPVLVAPGQPRLRVNVTLDEILRYSPRKVDVINLKTRTFETIDFQTLLKEFGPQYPMIQELVSIVTKDHLAPPSSLGIDFGKKEVVVTFDGLFTHTTFLEQIKAILRVLQETLNHPVDIEFAYDGSNFYLLQCRAQSYGAEGLPATIPEEISPEKIIFSANRYISNGNIPNITHIVYVNPQGYSELSDYQDLVAVGRAVGRLNQVLPKRQFILIGPGRWGSRGDIKLGVSVTYSDINNTAMLIEVARKQKDYIPEPSFGTHFFQDLVEASIRYLPIYPDDAGVVFNENYLTSQENLLEKFLPDYAHLSDVLQVVDVAASSNGKVLQVLMNSDIGQAVAILTESRQFLDLETKFYPPQPKAGVGDIHWRWRLEAAEEIAAQLDPNRFGVKGFYIFGSTKNATAGPASDIDILIHFQGTESQREALKLWLEGWSLCLNQINYLRTGYKVKGILDVHMITDEDIQNRTSYAVKIGAHTDPARPIALGTAYRYE